MFPEHNRNIVRNSILQRRFAIVTKLILLKYVTNVLQCILSLVLALAIMVSVNADYVSIKQYRMAYEEICSVNEEAL